MTEISRAAHAISSGEYDPQAGTRDRPAPKAIQLLLPVWGVQFIAQFLRVSLPTLLAPGNLPALAATLPTKFIFLTNTEGAGILSSHAAVNYMREICDVEIRTIDDLITGDNYSTTITLAYARAVRAAGPQMLDTCFFFLISDYIMADGSLANVLARMQSGYSGVVAGNFQVVEEDAFGPFFATFDRGEPAIVLRARNLMGWAIKYLHPMTLANMVNFPLCHSIHSNRLFWHVDENTLIGRFYLMHMICIRPEVMDFEVGSSCDYSFIPEMCPSGHVYRLANSDEYLVVEMQRRSHEGNFVRLGAVDQHALVESLAEWTTATHRGNAHVTTVFHAAELPSNLQLVTATASTFVETIEHLLPPPQPHRDHPYWLGAIAAHRYAVSRKKGLAPPARDPGVSRYYDLIFRWRNMVFGRPPTVRPWHPRWPDYRMIENLVRSRLPGSSKSRLLVISSTADVFRDWLDNMSILGESLDLQTFLQYRKNQVEPLINSFDGCLLVLRETEISLSQKLLAMIKPVLRGSKSIIVFAINGHEFALRDQFNDDIHRQIQLFFDPDIALDDVRFIRAGWVTWMALRGMRRAMTLALKNALWTPLAAVGAVLLAGVCFVSNLIRRTARDSNHNQACSSIALLMHETSAPALDQFVEQHSLDLAAQRFSKNRMRIASAASTETA